MGKREKLDKRVRRETKWLLGSGAGSLAVGVTLWIFPPIHRHSYRHHSQHTWFDTLTETCYQFFGAEPFLVIGAAGALLCWSLALVIWLSTRLPRS